MRMIDAEVFENLIKGISFARDVDHFDSGDILALINDAETVWPSERETACWLLDSILDDGLDIFGIYARKVYKCSQCEWSGIECGGYKFCPRCGARMMEEGKFV